MSTQIKTITILKYEDKRGNLHDDKKSAIVANYRIDMTGIIRQSRPSQAGPISTEEMAGILLNNGGAVLDMVKKYHKAMASVGNKRAAKKAIEN